MLLTVKDVAERLKVSRSCIYQLVESGRIRHHRIGLGRGAIRFTEEDLTEYLVGIRSQPTVSESRPSADSSLRHLDL